MKVRIIRELGDLASAVQTAARISDDSDLSPMQDPDWSLSCAETLTDKAALAVVAVEDEGKLIALAPFVHQGRGLLEGYEQLGVSALSEPSDFFYANEPALYALIKTLSKSKKMLTLGRVPSSSKSIEALWRTFSRRGIFLTSHVGSYPYIALDSIEGDVDTVLSGHLRRNVRRARRKTDGIGAVNFEVHAPQSEEEFLNLYAQFLQVEAAGWKRRAGTALAIDTRRQDFFRAYGIRASQKNALRITLLQIGADVAAMQFAVQIGGRFWLLKIAFDEKYSSCSPGLLLMYETLQYAAKQELRSFEFLGYSEPWTYRWTSLERTTIRIDACPLRPACILALTNKSRQRALTRIKNFLRRREFLPA